MNFVLNSVMTDEPNAAQSEAMTTTAPTATATATATPGRLQLDERQRQMLRAMGITGVELWLDPALKPQQPSSSPPSLVSPLSAENPSNLPIAGKKSAEIAIENIADFSPPPVTLAVTPPVSKPDMTAIDAPMHRSSGVEQMSWLPLQAAVSDCRACALCSSRKNTVFGTGQASADAQTAPQVDWLIVGEAPGEQEDLQGEPFVGPAGQLLDNMLAAMKVARSLTAEGQQPATGLSRQQGVYITNVLKCRPPANRNPAPEEVAQCQPYLARQIELLQPKIIIAMGRYAIQSLTGSAEPVGKLRGRVHPLQHPRWQAPVIVTYHPAYLLRNLPDKAKAWQDLLLAMKTYREL